MKNYTVGFYASFALGQFLTVYPLEKEKIKTYFLKIFFRQDLKNIFSSGNDGSWVYLTMFLWRDRVVSPKVALPLVSH